MSAYQPDLGLVLAREAAPWQDHVGHWLTLLPEEPVDGQERMWANTYSPVWPGDLMRGDWAVPTLRAVCSCGWKAPDRRRYVISENAIHYWRANHIAKVTNNSEQSDEQP